MSSKIEALKRQARLAGLKTMQRSSDKPQVLLPKVANDATMNRLTHSIMVKDMCRLMAHSIAEDGVNPDYQHAVENVGFAHDLGHPPGGHQGATLLDKRVKEVGVFEGFDDNNQTEIVLMKNGGRNILSEYEWASLIKYPYKLYPQLKDRQLHNLSNALNKDFDFYAKHGMQMGSFKTTLASRIMDLCDEISYVTADMADCYVMGFGDVSEIESLREKASFMSVDVIRLLDAIISAVKSGNKNLINLAFVDLRLTATTGYYLDMTGAIVPKNIELHKLINKLYEIEKRIFINNKEVVDSNDRHLEIIDAYITKVFNGFIPSKTYERLINTTSNEVQKYRLMRDMISETTDIFLIKNIKGEI